MTSTMISTINVIVASIVVVIAIATFVVWIAYELKNAPIVDEDGKPIKT